MDITKLIKDILVHMVWFVSFFIVATVLGFLILGMVIWDCLIFIIRKVFKKNKGLTWIEKNCLKMFKI